MSLIPQGVSGFSGAGGNINWDDFPNTVTPGAIFRLGKWVGQTLRHLSLSVLANSGSIFSILQIASDYPRGSLSPANALPNPLFQIYLSSHNLAYGGGPLTLNFDPGLITVMPGEDLYIVVYDWRSNGNQDYLSWSLNMLWEPLREE